MQDYHHGGGQVITTWTCGDRTQGHYTEWTDPADGSPFELLTFVDPDLALFEVYVRWPPGHSVEDLYATFFPSDITCT